MNLLFSLFNYFPHGGQQRNCLRIAQKCAESGHKVTLYTRTWDGPKPKEIKIITLGCKGWTNASRNQNYIKDLIKEIDKGSQKLTSAFSSKLYGEVADLGSGWGYLSKEALRLNDKITRVTLFENNFKEFSKANKYLIDQFIHGVKLKSYYFGKYKTKNKNKLYEIYIISKSKSLDSNKNKR